MTTTTCTCIACGHQAQVSAECSQWACPRCQRVQITEATKNPRAFVYASMADVIAANKSIGNHWFDRATMRFFKTRIESRLIAGHRFITSECGPDGRRAYTVREACPDGTIDTVGEFQGYGTLAQAKAAVLAYPEEKAS